MSDYMFLPVHRQPLYLFDYQHVKELYLYEFINFIG